MARALEPCPEVINDPLNQLGTYRGEGRWDVSLGLLERAKREKKWQWFGVFDERWALAGAIVRTGYAGKSFVWLFDRERSELVFDETITTARSLVSVANASVETDIASLTGLKSSWSITRSDRRFGVSGVFGGLNFDLVLTETLSPFTAVCPNAGGFNVTRKNVSLDARGRFWGTHEGSFENARAMMDHSHGSMDRKTSWKWAIGSGEVGESVAGFNLIEGFNADLENVVWVGEEQMFVSPCRFEQGEDVWTVQSEGGEVDLTLEIQGVRAEDLNLGLVSSRYSQPLGTWQGRLLGQEISWMVGVAEDHHAVW